MKILGVLFAAVLLLPLMKGDPQYKKDYKQGLEAQRDGQYEKALSLYEKALKEKPDFIDAQNSMGRCYQQMANDCLDQAADSFQKVLKIEPQNLNALEYQGEYFIYTGELVKAYKNYQTLETKPGDEASDLKNRLNPVLKEANEILKSYSPK